MKQAMSLLNKLNDIRKNPKYAPVLGSANNYLIGILSSTITEEQTDSAISVLVELLESDLEYKKERK